MLTEQYSHGGENILANIEHEQKKPWGSEHLLPIDPAQEAEKYPRYPEQGRLV